MIVPRKAVPALILLSMLTAPAVVRAEGAPTVVELFTSQSCYSCPPAEQYLGQLAERPGILALEFHVDYWNDLVYGSAGKWRDPFSSSANTDRQRRYNLRIRETAGVYTPQMVIDGRLETVGSRSGAVERSIRKAREAAGKVAVDIAAKADGGYGVRIGAPTPGKDAKDGAGQGEVWLLIFRKAVTTEVSRGENKGKTLTNHNIVTEIRRLGRWTGGAEVFEVALPATADGTGCAVLVQDDRPGPILGAAACPMPGA